MSQEDHEDCFVRERAEAICHETERILEDEIGLNTEQLGHFWQHMTEQCVLRLTRLRPEMVTRVREDL